MEATGRSCGVLCLDYCVPVRKIGRRFCTTLAQRKEFQENGKSQPRPFFPLRVSKSNLARAAIGVFGLGFVDAGLVSNALFSFLLSLSQVLLVVIHGNGSNVVSGIVEIGPGLE